MPFKSFTRFVLFGLLFAGFSTACTTNSRTLKRENPINAERGSENNQAARLANDRTLSALDRTSSVLSVMGITNAEQTQITLPIPAIVLVQKESANAKKSATIVGNLLERNESIIGAPATNQGNRIFTWLSDDPQINAMAVKREQMAAMVDGNRIANIRAVERNLIDLGMTAEKTHAKNLWHRFWVWSISTFGLGGIIAVCILFPAIVPILGSFVGWIVGKIPSLASWIGLVSMKAYKRSISAFQQAKIKAAIAGDSKTLELLRMTAAENTEPDVRLITAMKTNLGYVASETEIKTEVSKEIK
jgi:hypothetical protein